MGVFPKFEEKKNIFMPPKGDGGVPILGHQLERGKDFEVIFKGLFENFFKDLLMASPGGEKLKYERIKNLVRTYDFHPFFSTIPLHLCSRQLI